MTRAQWVEFFFQFWAGWGRVLKKSRAAGGFGSGRSIEIFDRVFRVIRVFRVEEAICNRDFEEEDEGERGKADTEGYGLW